jgi:hypothetical protein
MLRQLSMIQSEAWHNRCVLFQPRIANAILGTVLVLAGLCVGMLLPPMRYSIWWDAACSVGGVVAILWGLVAIARACASNASLTVLRVVRNVLLVGLIGWYLFSFLLSVGDKTGSGHCLVFRDAVVQTSVVPQSVSSPGQPAAFCSEAEYGILRSHYESVSTYGVPRDQQHKVITAVIAAHSRANGAPVQLIFYDRENWQVETASDGKSVVWSSRGPEEP